MSRKVIGNHILLRHRDIPDIDQLKVYKADGGFETFKRVVTKMQPDEATEIVKASGLRGRGGAGFPTGLKWSFIDKNAWPHYVVVNADESEPGTFKDREIMEQNPWQLFEGAMICAFAIQANAVYNYLRGEFWQLSHELDKKVKLLQKEGLLGDKLFGTDYGLRWYNHLGAGAYICGEETALLESWEGTPGQPSLLPPFPPSFGVFGKPTVVTKVETLANVPLIVEKGTEWFRKFGTENSPGTKVFSLSGNVAKPGNYELPLGASFRELIFEYGGGIPAGRDIKAIMPAGASSSLIVANEKALDTAMDYEHVQNVGAMLGSASIIVIDDSVDMKWLINKTVRFFEHESCGKCTPCREGTYWMSHVTERIYQGDAVQADVILLDEIAQNIKGKCLCALGDFSAEAVVSSIERFPEDFNIEVKVTVGDLG